MSYHERKLLNDLLDELPSSIETTEAQMNDIGNSCNRFLKGTAYTLAVIGSIGLAAVITHYGTQAHEQAVQNTLTKEEDYRHQEQSRRLGRPERWSPLIVPYDSTKIKSDTTSTQP